MEYKAAAESWRQDQVNNPDGWYADPESIMAVEEAVYEYERVGMKDPLEAAREAWRFALKKFKGSGGQQVWWAGEMVAIEKMIAARAS